MKNERVTKVQSWVADSRRGCVGTRVARARRRLAIADVWGKSFPPFAGSIIERTME